MGTFLKCLITLASAAAKSLQSCPTLCDPTDGSPPGSAVPGILQARTLEWVAISFSNAWKWKVKVKSLSRVGPLATPWTAAYQAPLSMGFSRQVSVIWGMYFPEFFHFFPSFLIKVATKCQVCSHVRTCMKLTYESNKIETQYLVCRYNSTIYL